VGSVVVVTSLAESSAGAAIFFGFLADAFLVFFTFLVFLALELPELDLELFLDFPFLEPFLPFLELLELFLLLEPFLPFLEPFLLLEPFLPFLVPFLLLEPFLPCFEDVEDLLDFFDFPPFFAFFDFFP